MHLFAAAEAKQVASEAHTRLCEAGFPVYPSFLQMLLERFPAFRLAQYLEGPPLCIKAVSLRLLLSTNSGIKRSPHLLTSFAKYYDGKTEEALRLFRELLFLNPNDNQGIRAMAQEALFKLGRFEDALKIAEQHCDDIMPETLYGRALALFKLGHHQEATAALREAIEYLPLVGMELLKAKHRLPKSARPGVVTVGGVLMRLTIIGNIGTSSRGMTLRLRNG